MGFFKNYARKLGKAENLLFYAETGVVSAVSFSGTPRKYTVTLVQAQPNASYSVTVTGEDARIWSVESRTTTGFVINSNADTALTGPVFWSLAGEI